MFWVLEHPEDFHEDIMHCTISGSSDTSTWKSVLCQSCKRFIGTEQLRDLTIELFGSEMRDFVWPDDPSIIVSEKLMKVLKTSDLEGFTFRNVTISHWWQQDPSIGENIDWLERDKPARLYQLVIHGSGGSILHQNEVQIRSQCGECGTTVFEPLKSGIIIDEDHWDRSGIFVVDEFPAYAFITNEFKEFLENHQIRGYKLGESGDYSM
jgi:hypothetical protein